MKGHEFKNQLINKFELNGEIHAQKEENHFIIYISYLLDTKGMYIQT